VAARGARRPVTIAVRPNAGLEEAGVGSSQVGGATLTFSEGPEATVELPLSPRRTRGT